MTNEEIRKKYKDRKPTKAEKEENLVHFCTFYRRNMNAYAEHYLGIKLRPFQHIMLYLMSVSQVFFCICSRGAGKTWLLCLFAFCKAMLYPYSEIHLTSSTIAQATKMIKDKGENELCKKLSPVLKYYYEQGLIEFHYGDEVYVDFKFNNSKFFIDPATDAARGGRATLLIYEECRLLKKNIVDGVFSKMAHPRQAMYLTLPEYQNREGKPLPRWIEQCQECYITSARFKSEWFWTTFKNVVTECYTNKEAEYNFFALDIHLLIEFGLKTVGDYLKSKKLSSPLEFEIEDLNEMKDVAEDAFFSLEDFKKNQLVKKAYKFPTIEEFNTHVDLHNRPKRDNEIRLLWIDFAFANTTSSEENDYSIIGCTSLIPKDDKWIRLTDYITSHPASDSDGINLKIREMFWDYKADYIVFDCRNGGEVIYTDLTKPRIHPNRSADEWNEHGFTISTDNKYQTCTQGKLDDLKSRTIDPQAIPCMIPIVGTSELNSNMWIDVQKQLRDESIELLVEDTQFEQDFAETNEYWKMNSEQRMEVMKPYTMTESLIGEAISLSQEWRNGQVKLTEPRSGTKDIIVSFSYGSYVSSLIINDKEKNQDDDWTDDDWAWLAG